MHFFRHKSHSTDEHSRRDHDPKEQRMEILLDHDFLFLRGTGGDSEPALLSGNIVLHLTEATTLRSITLQFRGKTYLSQPQQQDSFSSNSPTSIYVLCKHNWSFLEGEKKHSYTLKAGRHLFPFQLQVGGALPSSLVTDAFGGASVAYKLRAVAQRTGFSHNIQAVAPVYIIRSLGPTALEYQQTRDIEHVWQNKLMFYVAIPHVAWAAGDELVALLKITPIVKGVGVLSVTTSLRETTKLYNRTGSTTRTVATVTHEILGGRAVEMTDPVNHKGKGSSFPLPLRSTTAPEPVAGPSNSSSSAPSPAPATPSESEIAQGEDDVVTSLHLRIPSQLTPSHPLEPIHVSHSIHWSVFVTNADGHLSELFCSLPITLLDSYLLNEARSHTELARQLLIGGPEVSREVPSTNELPSYVAHVRDRIANMFLSEANSLRVTNPWTRTGVSPVLVGGQTSPGNATPLEVISDSNTPYNPDPEHPVFLNWVNAELLISQGATKVEFPSPSVESGGSSTPPLPHPDHPPTPPNGDGSGVATYTHALPGPANRTPPGIFAPTMEPASALTHPNWLATRPDPRPTSSAASSEAAVQRRVREVTVCAAPSMNSDLLHRAFVEVPGYEVALKGFLGGVPPLSSMQGLPSYAEASRSGTPDVGTRHGEGAATASAPP